MRRDMRSLERGILLVVSVETGLPKVKADFSVEAGFSSRGATPLTSHGAQQGTPQEVIVVAPLDEKPASKVKADFSVEAGFSSRGATPMTSCGVPCCAPCSRHLKSHVCSWICS